MRRPVFAAAQLVGVAVAVVMIGWLFPTPLEVADRVVPQSAD